jgi:coenzyme F420-0:L-glutamate ligase/coenzyme F420-1:gamma-L-glutamate ligase
VTIELVPVLGLPDVRSGDDLGALLAPALESLGVREGDVVVVTQKIVSKAEGRVVPEGPDGRGAWVERETRRVLARRDELVITETVHGFVCANAGVDASNVDAGFLTLLPEDPDGSAEALRSALRARLGVDVAVVVTDTFGRPWRRGLVNVAIGCAGLPSLVDLRGAADHTGRELEATVVALADEVAAASGLVMGKAARVPVAVVRGLEPEGPASPARELVRPRDEDLFRESPAVAIASHATARAFGEGDVPMGAIEQAVRAALTAPSLEGSRPWTFTALASPAARRRLVAALGGGPDDADAMLLRSSAVIVVPWLRLEEARAPTGPGRSPDLPDALLLSAGAAIESLTLALHALGIASAWTRGALVRQEATRAAVGMGEEWFALGAIAVGRESAEREPAPPPADVGAHLSER